MRLELKRFSVLENVSFSKLEGGLLVGKLVLMPVFF
jgi:hypothetical protein